MNDSEDKYHTRILHRYKMFLIDSINKYRNGRDKQRKEWGCDLDATIIWNEKISSLQYQLKKVFGVSI
jgi:hypothetical protein